MRDGAGVGGDLRGHWEIARHRTARDAEPTHVAHLNANGGKSRVRVARILARHDVLQQRAIGDGPSHRAVVVVSIQSGGREDGIAPVRRFEAHDAGEGRGRAERTADVRSGGEVGGSGRQRRARTAGRAARRGLEVPWIARGSPASRVGQRHAAELGRRRASVQNPAGRLDAAEPDRGLPRHPGRAQEGAFGDGVPGQGLFFLRRDRQSFERPRLTAGRVRLLRDGRRPQRLLEHLLGERVDNRLDPLLALDDRAHHLHRRELPGPEEAQHFAGGEVVEWGHGALRGVGALNLLRRRPSPSRH